MGTVYLNIAALSSQVTLSEGFSKVFFKLIANNCSKRRGMVEISWFFWRFIRIIHVLVGFFWKKINFAEGINSNRDTINFFWKETEFRRYNLLKIKVEELRFIKTKSLARFSSRAIFFIATAFTSCKSVDYYEAPTVYGARGKKVFAPPGMVYIPSGAITYKSGAEGNRRVSLSPFFMDATEVSNKQYRDFVNWVADSIAVTDILKDEKYFVKQRSHVRSKGKKGAEDQGAAALRQLCGSLPIRMCSLSWLTLNWS